MFHLHDERSEREFRNLEYFLGHADERMEEGLRRIERQINCEERQEEAFRDIEHFINAYHMGEVAVTDIDTQESGLYSYRVILSYIARCALNGLGVPLPDSPKEPYGG